MIYFFFSLWPWFFKLFFISILCPQSIVKLLAVSYCNMSILVFNQVLQVGMTIFLRTYFLARSKWCLKRIFKMHLWKGCSFGLDLLTTTLPPLNIQMRISQDMNANAFQFRRRLQKQVRRAAVPVTHLENHCIFAAQQNSC